LVEPVPAADLPAVVFAIFDDLDVAYFTLR
jgi:hypothetical protein